MMPTFGPTELIIILVIVLVLFGAGRIAGIGGSLGRAIRDFRSEVSTKDEPEDKPKAVEAAAAPPPPPTPPASSAPTEVSGRFCAACGAKVAAEARFCPSCGAQVPAATTATPSAPNTPSA